MAALAVAAAAAVATLALQSSGAATGVCATAPSGWKERSLPSSALGSATVVLTNFRFGRMDDFYGLASPLHWPRRGVMVAVSNEGAAATPRFRSALRVADSEFTGFEGLRLPAAETAVRRNGRVLNAYVEVGAVTPATVAAANAALAGFRMCSA